MKPDPAGAYWRGFADWATSGFDMPPLAVARAEAACIDTMACILAGFATPAFATARALDQGPSGRAFALAAAGHAFDFDDYDVPSIGHPSVVMVPVVLALTSQRHAMPDLIRAYCIGVEAMARMGEMVNPAHYEAGWHATATLGGIGAAAAAGAMLGLTRGQMLTALSLATGMTGGMKAQFGSMAKPFNAAFAARRGIDAALLAQAGADASASAFGRDGFAGLFHAAQDLPLTAPGAPLSVVQHGLIAKPSPCCGYLQRILHVCVDLRAQAGFRAGEIEKVILRVPPRNAAVIAQGIPETPDQARFSALYCTSVALLHGLPGLADFAPPALLRPDVIALARRVDLRPLPANLSPADLSPDDPDHIEIHLTGGRVQRRTEGRLPGSPDWPMTQAALAAKLAGCLDMLPDANPDLARRILALAACDSPAGLARDLWAAAPTLPLIQGAP